MRQNFEQFGRLQRMVIKDACVSYKLQKEEGDIFLSVRLIHGIWVTLCSVAYTEYFLYHWIMRPNLDSDNVHAYFNHVLISCRWKWSVHVVIPLQDLYCCGTSVVPVFSVLRLPFMQRLERSRFPLSMTSMLLHLSRVSV